MTEIQSIYESGDYLKSNPNWHIEDSPWKANQVYKILKKNGLKPKNIAEIGCGAGEILNQLHSKLESTCQFNGYEISNEAIQLCESRKKARLNFHLEDLLSSENSNFFDLLLIIDVIEHVEDYFSFLRKAKEKAEYKILHIPLDLSVQSLLRYKKIILGQRNSVGHIHYFTKEIAMEILNDCGYEIIDWFYTGSGTETKSRTVKNKIIQYPRQFFSFFSEDLSVRILGGYSLLVLAK